MPHRLVLASASPRRRHLLAQLGLDCDVRPVTIDESPSTGEQPAGLVLRLAIEKARACAATLGSDDECVVLGADTVVVCDGQPLGKPRDRDDGLAMLGRLSGRWHEVLTAVAVLDPADEGRARTALSRSRVRMRTIAPGEAAAYWATGEPADKAGGYALQGLGALFVEGIEGSCSGIVGLPLHETARLLSEYGIRVLPPDARARTTVPRGCHDTRRYERSRSRDER